MKIIGNLNIIEVKLPVPQVGSKRYSYHITNNKIILEDNSLYNTKIDYIVNDDNELLLGKGHYKLNDKKSTILMGGEIIINNVGKISYIDNNSGHYQPTIEEFTNFIEILSSIYCHLLNKDFEYIEFSHHPQ